MPVVGPRFLIEAGFIIVVAVVAGIERLGTPWIITVMGAAWLIVAAVEIGASRRRARAFPRPSATEAEEPPPAPPPPRPPLAVRAEPERERAPEPRPEPPRIVAVPPPPPEPEPEPAAESEPARVVAFTPADDGPREWNLWELERAARDHAGSDVVQNEERAYLLMYLRDFAGPDGMLPADFDGLVRDAFADVLHAAGT